MSNLAANLLGGLGRLLIAAGLLTLAFAGFQLWGTGLAESRAQDDLNAALEQTLTSTKDEAEPPAETEVEPAPNLAPEEGPTAGQPFGRIRIPKIDVEKVIVEGVNRDDLRQAPGHYPDTPLPGQAGNAGIAGHRTTYGQPFHDIDKLVPGDTIEVETMQGEFTYVVEGHMIDGPEGPTEVGHQIVLPSDVQVLEDKGDNRITLTACHPKFSAAQRIIVSAVMVEQPAAPTVRPPETNEPVELAESLGWQFDQLLPTALWGLALAAVVALAWLAARRWRRLWVYLLASPVFIVVMLFWFARIDHLIPAV